MKKILILLQLAVCTVINSMENLPHEMIAEIITHTIAQSQESLLQEMTDLGSIACVNRNWNEAYRARKTTIADIEHRQKRYKDHLADLAALTGTQTTLIDYLTTIRADRRTIYLKTSFRSLFKDASTKTFNQHKLAQALERLYHAQAPDHVQTKIDILLPLSADPKSMQEEYTDVIDMLIQKNNIPVLTTLFKTCGAPTDITRDDWSWSAQTSAYSQNRPEILQLVKDNKRVDIDSRISKNYWCSIL